MKDRNQASDAAVGKLVMNSQATDGLIANGHVRVECVRDGRVIWVEEGPNLIVTTGRNKLLDETLEGSGYTAAWYMGLIDNSGFSAIAAADTMASHAGWAEADEYDEATREAISFGAASSGTKATDADCSFTINATITINGVFIAASGTKNESASVLFAAKSFAAPRSCVDNDVLNVSYSASLTAS